MDAQAPLPVVAPNSPQLSEQLDEEEITELDADHPEPVPNALWWQHQSRYAATDTNPLEDDLPEDELDAESADRLNRPLFVSPLDQQTQQTNYAPSARADRDYSAQVAAAHQSPRCAHVRASGMRCGSPALRGSDYCYYHAQFHGRPRLIYPTLAKLDDAHGIQAALCEVLTAILGRRLEHKTGALLLYGLQTAVANLKHMPDLDPDDIVTDTPESHESEIEPDPEADAAADTAAAAADMQSAREQISSVHPISPRPSGDPATDGSYLELMAEYFDFDPTHVGTSGAKAEEKGRVNAGLKPCSTQPLVEPLSSSG